MQSGSLINIPSLSPDISSFIKCSPLALFNTLFRPSVFEANSLMMWPAAFENLLIIFMIFLAIVFFDKKGINKNIFYPFLFSVLFMFLLTGLITPVIGAMVRYKVPALPFLMIILVMMIDKEKFVKKILFWKK